jgi:hypothetical protein
MDWNRTHDRTVDKRTAPESQAAPARHYYGDLSNRFRSPEEQDEISRRVAIYASQVRANGRLTWLPQRKAGL